MRTGVVRAALTAGLLAPLLVAALYGQADAATAQADPCRGARLALEAGDYLRASQLYASDADQPLSRACGQAGLTATSALSAAGQLLAAGMTAQAGPEIVRALDAVPLLTLPADLVPQGTARQDEAVAEMLDAAGFQDQAVAILQRTVSGDPSFSDSLDPDAKNILGLVSRPLYLRVWDVIWQGIANPDAIVGWLAVLAILLLANLPKLIRRLYLQQFTATDGAGAGASLAAEFRSLTMEELGRLARETARTPGGRRLRLHLAGPYDDRNNTVVEQLVNQMSSRMQALYRVIALCTSRLGARSSMVTGTLVSETAVELGLKSVTGKPQGDKAIKHEDLGFPGDGDFQASQVPQAAGQQGRMRQMALAAAAWIILTRYRRRKVSLGGTTDWASYVAFAAGCAWEAAGSSRRHQDHARARYQQARRDTANTAARINLAAMDLAADLKSKPEVPIETLDWYVALNAIVAATRLRRSPLRRRPRDLHWYQARFLLAMGLRDFMEAVPQAAAGVRAYFEREARELTAEVAIELRKRERALGRLPREFVKYGYPAAIALLARQVMTWTGDPRQVVTRSESPGFDTATIGGELRWILNSPEDSDIDKQTSAKLAEFVVTAGLSADDDQVQYQLARLSRRRYDICVEELGEWDNALRDNPAEQGRLNLSNWRDDVKNYMNQLWEDATAERAKAEHHQRQVKDAGDPFLAPEVAWLQEQKPLNPDPPRADNWNYPEEGPEARQARQASRLEPPGLTPPPEISATDKSPLASGQDDLSATNQSQEEPPAPSPQASTELDRRDNPALPKAPTTGTGTGTSGESGAPTRPDLPVIPDNRESPDAAGPAATALSEMASPAAFRQPAPAAKRSSDGYPFPNGRNNSAKRPNWLVRFLRQVGFNR